MEDFEQASAGASSTFPMQCSALRKNGHVVINNRPCKVVELKTSKTGKHGHAKIHIIGIDIFTGKKLEDLSPSTHNVDVPIVSKEDFQLVSITHDGYCSLLTPSLSTKEDLKLPESELGEAIQSEYDSDSSVIVTVLKAMDEENIVAYKISEK